MAKMTSGRYDWFGLGQGQGPKVGKGETRNSDVSSGPQTHYPGAANHDTAKQPGNWFGLDAKDTAHATHGTPYPVPKGDTHAGSHGYGGANRQFAYSKAGAVGATAKQTYPFVGDNHAGTHGKAGGNRRYAYAQLGNYTGGQRTDFMKQDLPSEAHYGLATSLANQNRPSSSSFPAPETVREHSAGHGGAAQNWLGVTRKGRSAVVRDTGKQQAITQNRSFPQMPKDAGRSKKPVLASKRVLGRGFTNVTPQSFPSQSR